MKDFITEMKKTFNTRLISLDLNNGKTYKL